MQSSLILYSSFTLFLVFFITVVSAFSIFKRRRRDKEATSFAFLLFFTGLIFLFSMARNIFFWAGYPAIDKIFFQYFVHTFSSLAIPGAVYWIVFKIFKKEKIAGIAGGAFTVLAIIFIYVIVTGEVGEVVVSDWGTEYAYPLRAAQLLKAMISVIAILMFYDLILIFIDYAKKKIFYWLRLLPSLSLLVVGFGAGIDIAELNKAWLLLLGRIICLSGAMIAYFCYPKKEEIIESEKG